MAFAGCRRCVQLEVAWRQLAIDDNDIVEVPTDLRQRAADEGQDVRQI